VSKDFFDPSTGLVAAIEKKLGVSTSSGGTPSPSAK
jgi:hypothetical protein